MRTASLLLLTACTTVVRPVQSPSQPPELTQLQGAPSQSLTIATSLCDTAGARLAGSEGDARAVKWAVDTMNRLGLQNVHTEPVTVQKWTRGVERAEVTSPAHHVLSVVALGNSVATSPAGVEGEVIEVESLDALQALKPGSLTGKILFANVPMRRTNDGKGYGEASPVRRLAGLHGATAGAIATVIRSVGTDTNRLGHTGAQGYGGHADIPGAALSIPDAELVHRLVAAGPTKLHLTLTPTDDGPAQSANVIGEVVGSEKPEDIVLIGAHLDSWDLGTGAIDDAAGVGLMLDVMAKLLPMHPKRTVRVVLFANEENGLAGGIAYTKAHEAEHHVVAMEADIGGDRALAIRFSGGDEGLKAVKGWNPWFVPLDVHVSADAAHGGADISLLRAAGVPVIDVHQDASRYFDLHHTANDTVDKLDEAQLTQAARAWSTVVWLAANEPVDFGRIPEELRKRH